MIISKLKLYWQVIPYIHVHKNNFFYLICLFREKLVEKMKAEPYAIFTDGPNDNYIIDDASNHISARWRGGEDWISGYGFDWADNCWGYAIMWRSNSSERFILDFFFCCVYINHTTLQKLAQWSNLLLVWWTVNRQGKAKLNNKKTSLILYLYMDKCIECDGKYACFAAMFNMITTRPFQIDSASLKKVIKNKIPPTEEQKSL